MKNIFITATNTDIGKTYTTTKIASYLYKKGYKVGVFKPIETGVKDIPQDGQKLLYASNNKQIFLDDVVPIRYELPAAPYIAKLNNKINFEKILRSYKKIQENSDIVLVEGAGGLLTPVEKDFFMVDFIKLLDIDKTLLISSNQLGSINDTLLSQNLLKQKDIPFFWVVNEYKEKRQNYEKITLPFFKKVYYVDEISSWIDNLIDTSILC